MRTARAAPGGRRHDGLLSSHLLAEVEELCNRVAIVRSGRIVYEGALAELKRTAGGRLPPAHDRRRPRAVGCATRRPASRHVAPATATAARFSARRPSEAVGALSVALVEAGVGDPRAGARPAPRSRSCSSALTEGDGAPTAATAPRARSGAGGMRPGVFDRLPLGAAQAALPEAHLPRPRRRDRRPDHLRGRARDCRAGSPRTSSSAATCASRGCAIPLVVLIFGSIWLFPLVTSLVAGDIFASEDHNGTLKTILTRSLDRGQIFAGKVARHRSATPSSRSSLMGHRGDRRRRHRVGLQLAHRRCPARRSRPLKALGLVGASLGVYLLPMLAIAAIGLLLSTITRNSAAAVVGTLMIALLLQLVGIIPGLGRAPALPAAAPVRRLAGPAARADRLGADRPRRVGVRAYAVPCAGGGLPRLPAPRRRRRLAGVPERVLVVDDDPPVRRMLDAQPRRRGLRGRARPPTAAPRWPRPSARPPTSWSST